MTGKQLKLSAGVSILCYSNLINKVAILTKDEFIEKKKIGFGTIIGVVIGISYEVITDNLAQSSEVLRLGLLVCCGPKKMFRYATSKMTATWLVAYSL